MKILLEDNFIYPLMKRKGTILILEAEPLIEIIRDKSTNPSQADIYKLIENINLNTKDNKIQLIATGRNDYIIGYEKRNLNT